MPSIQAEHRPAAAASPRRLEVVMNGPTPIMLITFPVGQIASDSYRIAEAHRLRTSL